MGCGYLIFFKLIDEIFRLFKEKFVESPDVRLTFQSNKFKKISRDQVMALESLFTFEEVKETV